LHFIAWASEQIPVYYITGNHDEYLRKFADTELGSLKIKNKLSLKLNNKQVWIFHGDVFDVVMQHSKWLAKLGSIGYDALIFLNRLVNTLLLKMGRERVSISKKIKNSVKKAVAFMNKFEDTVCSIAAEHNYDYAICGHIHQPEKKIIVTPHGVVHYLNSGDWIENLSALEYNEDQWKLYFYEQDAVAQQVDLASLQSKTMDIPELFNLLISQTQKV
jgi:UDP-2,3-diacylglucosamine pyrophosphatase LpxH